MQNIYVLRFMTNDFCLCTGSSINYPAININSLNMTSFTGSGWVFKEVRCFEVRIAAFRILRAGCNVAVPNQITSRKAVVDVKSCGERFILKLKLIYYFNPPFSSTFHNISMQFPDQCQDGIFYIDVRFTHLLI